MILTGHGGAREGAGRPRADILGQERRKHSIYCTKTELLQVREFLKVLRAQEEKKFFCSSRDSMESERSRGR